MKPLFLILLTFTTILLISCKDDDNETPSRETISFGGITSTDETGIPISVDPSDWKLSESWSGKENYLFFQKMDEICLVEENTVSFIAYPNPCMGQFTLRIHKPEAMRFAFRIVDKDFNLVMWRDSIYSQSMVIDTRYFNILNDTVRMYYKLFGTSCELQGHGDILIN
jgi:hypothetical protein